MKILIVGAGIAGLAMANHLRQTDWEVQIVERADQFDRRGYGIGLWRNGQTILADLGLLEPLRARGVDVRTWQMRRADGRLLNSLEVGTGDDHSDLLVVHRADLHDVLLDPIPDDWLQMGTTVDDIDAGPEIADVTLTDKTRGEFDLVVGADGIKSKLRDLCFDGWTVDEIETATFSVWIPPEGPDFDHPVEWLGPDGSTLLAVPVGDRAMVNFGLSLDPDTPIGDPLEFLRDRTDSMGWVVPDIFESIPDDTEIFWTRNAEVQARQWYSDRAVLVGDAAHALHPIVGMGASLALEDTRLMYELLDDKAPDHVDEALRRFEARRKKRLRRFSRLSWLTRKTLLTHSSVVAAIRNFVLRRSSSLMDLFVSDADPVREPFR